MSNIIREKRRVVPSTRVRAFEVRDLDYPHYTWADWKKAIAKDSNAVSQIFDNKNKVLDEAMELMARFQVGEEEAWDSMRWYKQDLGTSGTAPAATDVGVIMPLFRKGFSEHIRTARELVSNTFFTAADFLSATTTVATVTSTTIFTLTSATGFKIGDMIRVGLTSGYEYRTIQNLVGVTVTLDSALSVAPSVADTIDQVVEEAGFVGSKAANYTTGTVTATNGSPTITGSGTAWLANVGPGDKILVRALSSSNRTFYEVLSVDSDTQITLTSNFAETTGSGLTYILRGIPFNRVNGIRHVKIARGIVLENSWTMGGS